MVQCPAKIRRLARNFSFFLRTRQIQSGPRISGQKRCMDFYTLSRQLLRDGGEIAVHNFQSLTIATSSVGVGLHVDHTI